MQGATATVTLIRDQLDAVAAAGVLPPDFGVEMQFIRQDSSRRWKHGKPAGSEGGGIATENVALMACPPGDREAGGASEGVRLHQGLENKTVPVVTTQRQASGAYDELPRYVASRKVTGTKCVCRGGER